MKTGLNAPIVRSGTTVTRVSRFLLVLFVNQMSGTICFVCNHIKLTTRKRNHYIIISGMYTLYTYHFYTQIHIIISGMYTLYTYHFYTQIHIIISGTYTLYTYHFYTQIYIDLSIMTIFMHLISPRQCCMSRIVYSILI